MSTKGMTAPKPCTDLFLYNVFVDFSGGDVVVSRQSNIQITLIVAQIEVDLSTIVQNVDFACGEQNRYKLLLSSEGIEASEDDLPCSVGAIVPASIFM